MPTGYDLIEHSHEFRMHILRRLAAALIDAAFVFVPVILVVYLLELEPNELLAGVLSGFAWFLYSAAFDGIRSATPGKKVMNLIVVSLDGPMTLSKAVVRNVPKMFWYVFIILDFFVGLGLSKDPRQRWVDTVSNTIVIKKEI